MCFEPNLIRFSCDPDTGTVVSKFIGSAKFVEIDKLGTPYVDKEWYLPVPCGSCLHCRLDYSRQWADRLALEFSQSRSAIFVTLTYDQEHVPRSDGGYLSLSVRDCQLFLKRLRSHFSDRKLRFVLSGEYGTRGTLRPHYHAIIFNLALSDFDDLSLKSINELGNPFFISKKFQRIWGNGFCLLSDVSWHTFSYVARYTTKKLMAKEFPWFDRKKPFILSSRRPGIGMDIAHELLKSGKTEFSFQDSTGVRTFKIPQSIIKRFREKSKKVVDIIESDPNNPDSERIVIFDIDFDPEILYPNIGGYIDDLKYQLSNFDGYLYQFFQLQKSVVKSKFNILPERR